MRYLKGSKVEVLNTMDPTSPESWWPAEILSGNEHTYRVMYDDFPPDSWAAVRVPRKNLRPCPPLVMGLSTWHEGDHVEVFEHNSWKPGVVVGKDGSCFSVTILGGSREIKVYGCDVRVRRTWQYSRWIMTDKGDLNSDVQVIDKQSKLKKYIRQNIEVKKRTSRKMRAIGDNGRVQRRNVKAPYPVPEKGFWLSWLILTSQKSNILLTVEMVIPAQWHRSQNAKHSNIQDAYVVVLPQSPHCQMPAAYTVPPMQSV